jgi:hypothetical protein
MVDVLTFPLTPNAKVYIIGGDGTQKGANVIYEVSSLIATVNGGVRIFVQDIVANS